AGALTVGGPLLMGMSSLLGMLTKLAFLLPKLNAGLLTMSGMSGATGLGATAVALGKVAGALGLIVGAGALGWKLGTWIDGLISKFGPLKAFLDMFFGGLYRVWSTLKSVVGLGPEKIAATTLSAEERQRRIQEYMAQGFASGTLNAPGGLA